MAVPMQEYTLRMTCTVIYHEITEKNASVLSRTTVSKVSPSDKN